MTNKQITLASRPTGFPKESDFQMAEAVVPELQDGQILVRVIYLSLDPYMRGRMSAAKSYAAPVEIGEVMGAGAVGRVERSRNPNFKPGEIVSGMFGWQQYAVSEGKGLFKVDPNLAPISTALGVLGMPGLTAYFGLLDIGRPKAGETVVVSGAAGAVGSYVGQIAKILGCRVVGIAGTDDKIDYLIHELGFAAAFNYKTVTDYRAKLQELCPEGIDVYFDNVGGAITDAVFLTMNQKARIAICGQISQYNLEKPEMGPRLLPMLIVKRARVEGFLIFDYQARFPEALPKLAEWVREGKLKYRETVAEGIENAPAAFIGMLQGRNTGKQLVKLSEP
ncbi:MAG: NADP-dependent oxidoreductase [Acidobacteriota bacterium]|nr:NADP-dependent oxidoreductase [Acidobacteriota bacterium]